MEIFDSSRYSIRKKYEIKFQFEMKNQIQRKQKTSKTLNHQKNGHAEVHIPDGNNLLMEENFAAHTPTLWRYEDEDEFFGTKWDDF